MMNNVKLIFGENVIKKELSDNILGKKALIVTGRSSAVLSGAQSDVTDVLSGANVEYVIYNGVRENPTVEAAFSAGCLGRENGCDFVIGIGGGSALDAAKAAAAFAADSRLTEENIFTSEIKNALPIMEVPTTAGTGSEANRFSVLTLDGGMKKRTYKSEKAYPKVSFLDPKYTYSMSDYGSVSCALDAFSHCIESYLSPKATEVSKRLSCDGGRDILSVIMKKSGGFDAEEREKLLFAASLGGRAIDITGTGFTHPLGYSVTLSHGVPHGMACGIFFSDYVDYNYLTETGRDLLDEFFAFCGYSAESVKKRIAELSETDIVLNDAEAEEYIDRVSSAANFQNSPYVISRAEMSEIYKRLFVR